MSAVYPNYFEVKRQEPFSESAQRSFDVALRNAPRTVDVDIYGPLDKPSRIHSHLH